ncbi:hsp90 co-chaperone Cdc37 [Recurvomyces mirabilis]|nr:hsp90 co-chaperone Cdc37 [Recurvomyces mirabilis]
MPVDYSKWDALELSDDSDIEVHPNVDKRSFIRAKQNQIHQQRLDHALLKSLGAHKKEVVAGKKEADVIDEVVFDALVEVQGDGSLGDDQPPAPPQGVHANEQQPSYSKMMGTLVDQVKSEVDKAKADGPARYEAYLKEVAGHEVKVKGLQKDLLTELNKLEKEEGSKITSDSIHMGFDTSHVAKAPVVPVKTEPELMNPKAIKQGGAETAGSEADIEDGAIATVPGEEAADDDMEASPLAKRFGRIPYGDYPASLRFISEHPEVLAEKETDGLLVEAFNGQSNATNQKEEDYARQCVHQALLLQYCRQLGKDGVGLFFKRIQTQNHQARKLFLDDVNTTYARIRSRTAELAREREADGGERETIQLHAVDPNTTINIVTPPSLADCTNDDERTAREIFDTFPPGLQRALQSGSLEKVNEVLAKMSVDEAEQVVEQLGNGGMLSLEEGVIDATTEEGQKQVEEIERTRAMPGEKREVEEVGEPGGERIVELPEGVDEMD